MKLYAKAVELNGKVQLVFNLPKDAIRENDQFVEQASGDSWKTVERFEKKYGIRLVERMLPQYAAMADELGADECSNPRYFGWFLQI